MLNHVTYHLSRDELGFTCLEEIMVDLLGFEEVKPDDPFEHGYEVRWFRPVQSHRERSRALQYNVSSPPLIHFVADGAAQDLGLGLGHFATPAPAGSGWSTTAGDSASRSARHEAGERDAGSARQPGLPPGVHRRRG
jgi:hypothetical protein